MDSHTGPDWVGILPVEDFHAVWGDIEVAKLRSIKGQFVHEGLLSLPTNIYRMPSRITQTMSRQRIRRHIVKHDRPSFPIEDAIRNALWQPTLIEKSRPSLCASRC